MPVSPGPAPVPPSVRYPLAVLAVQAGLWILVVAAGLAALAFNARAIISGHGAPPHGAGAFAVDVALLGGAAGMAAVSVLVLAGLRRGRAGARVAAIALECSMACFGIYLAWWSAGGLIAGGLGAAVSCAAAVCLLRRPARQFTRPLAPGP